MAERPKIFVEFLFRRVIYIVLFVQTFPRERGAGMKPILTVMVVAACVFSSGVSLAEGDAKAGEAVYNRACKMCHGTGMARAPKTGDETAWEARVARGTEELTKNAIKGVRAMPPRGGCGSCSNEDIANAVAYMLAQVK